MQAGLASVTFRQLPPAEVARLAAEAGLAGIEWGGDIHVPHGDREAALAAARLSRDHGLQVASYGSYYRLGDFSGEPAWSDVMASARELGAPVIRVWAGQAGSPETPPDPRRRVVDDALAKAEEAGKAGIAVAVEYHDGTLTDTNESTRRFLAEANHPNLLSLWQPRIGAGAAEHTEGLVEIGARLSHLHVFHWIPEGKEGFRQLPLADGAEQWRGWLARAESLANPSGRERWAIMEHVRENAPAYFLEDARALLSLLPRGL